MEIGNKRYAKVNVKPYKELIVIPITSPNKPHIPEEIQKKWQNIVDLVARIFNVPSGQITRFTEEHLQIFRASKHTGYPLKNSGLVSYIGVPIQWEDGEIFGTFCLLDNKSNSFSNLYLELMLNFKEIIESDLKYLLINQELQRRLSTKELLLREAYHRLNNHFALLMGYIQLKSLSYENSPNIQHILKDIHNRIHSISLIHEKLSYTENLESISLDTYICELCNIITSELSKIKIKFLCNIEPITLPIEISLPIGLMCSELITNSIKYAFSEVNEPEISLQIFRDSSQKIINIHYKDNGKGFPDDFDILNSNTLGMNLIKLQVEELDGEIKVSGKNGAEFFIKIKY
ncbi:MAG: sensor histidine kinase [Chitinispirillaceae bacterium]|nr:sensor histidine kinase [Chitinispirillaceae bacterium]